MIIGKYKISDDDDTLIIAEVGVNYDNDINLAEDLIISAKNAGAHIVKFQTYTPSKIVAINSPKYWEDDNPNESQYEFFKRSNKFYHEETKTLAKLCQKHDILFMSTPFDLESVDLLEELNVPAYKVASADITNIDLLIKIAKTNKPIILSTGASNIGEISNAVNIINSNSKIKNNIALLHCILSYPTPFNNANLNMIRCLRDLFPLLNIGWSDHVVPDESAIIPVVSAVLGANIIEKHFSIDISKKGNDHFHSMNEKLIQTMITNIKIAKSSLGNYFKEPIKIEEQSRKFARRSIGVKNDLKKGQLIKDEDLIMLRPGTGIKPGFKSLILNSKLKKDIKKGYLLSWEDFLDK